MLFSTDWETREMGLEMVNKILEKLAEEGGGRRIGEEENCFQFETKNNLIDFILIKSNDENENVRCCVLSIFKTLSLHPPSFDLFFNSKFNSKNFFIFYLL